MYKLARQFTINNRSFRNKGVGGIGKVIYEQTKWILKKDLQDSFLQGHLGIHLRHSFQAIFLGYQSKLPILRKLLHNSLLWVGVTFRNSYIFVSLRIGPLHIVMGSDMFVENLFDPFLEFMRPDPDSALKTVF